MSTDARVSRTLRALRHIAPPTDGESAWEGGSWLGDDGLRQAFEGVFKRHADRASGRFDALMLEAIIYPTLRPVLDVRDGTARPDGLDASWSTALFTDDGLHPNLRRALPAIGRIDVKELGHAGTGFLVGPGLLLTNRHVAREFASGVGRRQLWFRPGRTPTFDPKLEVEPSATLPLTVTQVVMIHPWWDAAFIRVDGLPDDVAPLALDARDTASLDAPTIAVIGYPAFDSRNDRDVQKRVFREVFGRKRIQPGYLRGRTAWTSFDHVVQALGHDASTLGGNSGSAVIDVATGTVVGLHFAGRYLETNVCVPAVELLRDPRVRELGLSLPDPTAPAPAWTAAWDRLESPATPAAPAPALPPVTPPSSPPSSPPPGPDPAPARLPSSLRLEARDDRGRVVPVTLQVASADDIENTQADGTYRILPDPDYHLRKGYDPAFLGAGYEVPFPELSPEHLADAPTDQLSGDDAVQLRYEHFSLVMSRRRRLARVTGVNIDGARIDRIPRDKFRDRWFYDPRIPRELQLGNRLYAGNPLDRGHLVRRLDPTWGEGVAEVERAHDDTFHWTNCGPQHEGFNQGDTLWAGIEDYLLDNADHRNLRLSVFSGPVLQDDDPVYRMDDGEGVRVPVLWWKVAVMVSDQGRLHATAYLLTQASLIDDITDAEFVFGQYRTFQTSVADIEARTGLSFGDLRRFDPLEEPTEGATPLRELSSGVDPDLGATALSPEVGGVVWTGLYLSTVDTERVAQAVAWLEDHTDATWRVRDEVAGGWPGHALLVPDLGRPSGNPWDTAAGLAAHVGADAEPLFATPWVAPRTATAGEESLPGLGGTPHPHWNHADVHLDAAWGQLDGKGRGVRVAHIDTGITEHPELLSATEGRLDLAHGLNTLESGPPWDRFDLGITPFHGTATAGVLHSPHGLVDDVRGVAPDAVLVPMRVTDSVVMLHQAPDLARAIRHAVAVGCDVVTISLGGLQSGALEAAVQAAEAADVIVCAAAGNGVRFTVWPANYRTVVACAASGPGKHTWVHSCRGPAVDITAPGHRVWVPGWTLTGRPKVDLGSGTSFATPTVAGAAALWLQQHGGRDALRAKVGHGKVPAAFRWCLRQTAQGELHDAQPGQWGAGLLDVDALLRHRLPTAEDIADGSLGQDVGSALAWFGALLATEGAPTPALPALPLDALAEAELLHLLLTDARVATALHRAANAESATAAIPGASDRLTARLGG